MATTPFMTLGAPWGKLEPAQRPMEARTKHIRLSASVHYDKGQAVQQKDDGSNEYAAAGTAGFTGPALLLKYPTVTNASRKHQHQIPANPFDPKDSQQDSVDAYHMGDFYAADLIGVTDANLAALGMRMIQGRLIAHTNAIVRLGG